MDHQTNLRIAQLEEENHTLRAQLKQEQERNNNMLADSELKRIINHLPEGTMYRSVRDMKTGVLSFYFVSETWEKITGVSPETSIADMRNVFSRIEANDLQRLMETINRCLNPLSDFTMEVRFHHPKRIEDQCWIQISSYPRREGEFIYADGYIFDITARKIAELNLLSEKERLLETNIELQTATEELSATSEALYTANDELQNANKLLQDEINARIEVIKKLEDSEATMLGFLNQTFEGIAIMDDKGRVIEWNNVMEKNSGIPREKALGKYDWDLMRQCLPDDDFPPEVYEHIVQTRTEYFKGGCYQKVFTEDISYRLPNESIQYVHTSMFPIALSDRCLFARVNLNITDKKIADMELEKYRLQLESMVELRTKELKDSQDDLLTLSRRQDILIKVLQMMHSADNLSEALDASLDLLGQYTGVSRVYIFERSADGTTFSNTHEWCNEGITPYIDNLQNEPIENAVSWFDIFDTGKYICTNDIYSLTPAIAEILEKQNIKSIIVLPLTSYGYHYGFVGFDECAFNRVWDEEEVALLKNLSQIISTALQRHQAEKVIQQSQQTMQTVLNNITSSIFVTDFETKKILFANKAFKDAAGQEVENVKCYKIFQEGRDKPCDYCPQALLRDANNCPTNYIHIWEDFNTRTERWYTIASTAFRWIDGRLSIMELATDITDRKLSEIELANAKEKAEESDRLKSAFLANMSHEIRTPINGITGFLRLINADDLPTRRRQEYINIINNSSTQLVKLIDDIIDVAKIEAHQMDINPIPVKINDLMEELLLFFETYIQVNHKYHLSLILDNSGFINNCVAMVDSTRLRQVIINLINNAIKFTEKGFIRFGYRQSSPDRLEFVVEDTGIGIKREQQEIIFERFRQAQMTHNRLYGGTGLGLNISRSLIQMMGGDMWVKSVEGGGSSFYFTISYLPVKPENV